MIDAATLPITTTLAAIRAHGPCKYGWARLLQALGKSEADDEPLAFSAILESNGIEDALWCLRSLPEEHHPSVRLMMCDFAEYVLPVFEKVYPQDGRPRVAIDTARRFAQGGASQEELNDVYKGSHGALTVKGDALYAAAWASTCARPNITIEVAHVGEVENKIQAELIVKYFG